MGQEKSWRTRESRVRSEERGAGAHRSHTSVLEPQSDRAWHTEEQGDSFRPVRRDREAAAGKVGGMGGDKSGCVVGLRIEGAREDNPLEPTPGGCSKGEGAVEDSVHVGTVPPGL